MDDKPFSGGAGMVLRPDIISSAIEKNFSSSDIKNFKNSKEKAIKILNDLDWKDGFFRKDIAYKVT